MPIEHVLDLAVTAVKHAAASLVDHAHAAAHHVADNIHYAAHHAGHHAAHGAGDAAAATTLGADHAHTAADYAASNKNLFKPLPTDLKDVQIYGADHAAAGHTAATTHLKTTKPLHFAGGCDCGFSPGTCGAGWACRWSRG